MIEQWYTKHRIQKTSFLKYCKRFPNKIKRKPLTDGKQMLVTNQGTPYLQAYTSTVGIELSNFSADMNILAPLLKTTILEAIDSYPQIFMHGQVYTCTTPMLNMG